MGRERSEAGAGQVFHTGERFRLKLQATATGYLAVVRLNSDGRGGLLYPKSEGDLDRAPMLPQESVVLPRETRSVFRVNGLAGTEWLWIVFARDRLTLSGLRLKAEMSARDIEDLRRAARLALGAKSIDVEEIEDPDGRYVYLIDHAGSMIVRELALTHEN